MRRSLTLQPTAPRHVILSSILSSLGDLEGSESQCREAVRLEPENDESLFNLARVLLERGDESGLRLLERAVESAPDDPRYLEDLGLHLGRIGQYERAKQAFVRAIECGAAGSAVWSGLATTEWRLGSDELAEAAYVIACSREDGALAWAHFAEFALKTGRVELARRLCEHASGIDPEDHVLRRVMEGMK